MNREFILSLNAQAQIAFALMMIAFALMWIAFYKKPASSKSSRRKAAV